MAIPRGAPRRPSRTNETVMDAYSITGHLQENHQQSRDGWRYRGEHREGSLTHQASNTETLEMKKPLLMHTIIRHLQEKHQQRRDGWRYRGEHREGSLAHQASGGAGGRAGPLEQRPSLL